MNKTFKVNYFPIYFKQVFLSLGLTLLGMATVLYMPLISRGAINGTERFLGSTLPIIVSLVSTVAFLYLCRLIFLDFKNGTIQITTEIDKGWLLDGFGNQIIFKSYPLHTTNLKYPNVIIDLNT